MRRKVKTPRRHETRPEDVQRYRPDRPLEPEQERNLRFRGDCYGPDGRTPVFASTAERTRAWADHRARFIEATNLGTRCPAFWQCEPAVPTGLRELPLVTGYASLDDAVRDHHRISRARRLWLLENPAQLREGEAAEIQRQLAPPMPHPRGPDVRAFPATPPAPPTRWAR